MIVAGIDIGSLSSKAVVMADGQILSWSIILTGPDSSRTAEEVMGRALNGLSWASVDCTVATGYGRINVPFAQRMVTEISCHARGAHWLFPQVRTILDMGGQDCKAIRVDEQGRVTDFVMNDKCAAGTGRYLERVAATLGLPLDRIGPLSLQPVVAPVHIDSYCAVFAEMDVVKAVRKGAHPNDILAGATDAIVKRICTLLGRVGVEEAFMVSGGVGKNTGITTRLEKLLGIKALRAPEPQIVGALGAALFAQQSLKAK